MSEKKTLKTPPYSSALRILAGKLSTSNKVAVRDAQGIVVGQVEQIALELEERRQLADFLCALAAGVSPDEYFEVKPVPHRPKGNARERRVEKVVILSWPTDGGGRGLTVSDAITAVLADSVRDSKKSGLPNPDSVSYETLKEDYKDFRLEIEARLLKDRVITPLGTPADSPQKPSSKKGKK